MLQAILSDIHGNLEALRAVLHDVEKMNADAVICLGDLVGYGPDPIDCTEVAMHWQVVLQGNFDHAVANPDGMAAWSGRVSKMMDRIRQRITQHKNGEAMMNFIANLPSAHTHGDALFVHGSPRDHLEEYVFPEDIYDAEKLSGVFANFDKLCFCGHTHVAGVFSKENEEWIFVNPSQCDNTFSVSDQKVLCNVGSVGQPLDGDHRACYVLFDGQTITFRRIEYDYITTARKIRDGDDDDMHGDRLSYGR